MHKRRIPILLAAASLLLAAGPRAQPSQGPTRVLVGSAAGGPADLLGRLFASSIETGLGAPAVLENRPGASGTLAAAEVAREKASSSFLVAGMGSVVAAPYLYRHLAYDPARDLVPVALLAGSPMVLVAPKSMEADDAEGLRRAARARAGRGLSFASSGIGTANHLCAERLVEALGIEAVHVPFQGDSQAQAALVAGDADFMFMSPNVALPLLAAGRVRALAVSQPRRLPQLAETPTLAQFGLPGLACQAWTMAFAPAGTAPALREQAGRAWARALSRPAVLQRLRTLGLDPPEDPGPHAAAELLHEERQRMAQLARRLQLDR